MRKKIYLILIGCIVAFFYSVTFFYGRDSVLWGSGEDGFIENFGAFCFLLASILLFINFIKKRNVFILLLGILMFIAFGEEISWGQRIFNIKTPESLESVNAQQEINIHNINIFQKQDEFGRKNLITIDRLFTLFWFIYCFFLPLLNKYNSFFSKLFKKVHLPIGPIWLGLFFLGNYLISKVLEAYTAEINFLPLIETKESLFSFLFVLLSWHFLTHPETPLETEN